MPINRTQETAQANPHVTEDSRLTTDDRGLVKMCLHGSLQQKDWAWSVINDAYAREVMRALRQQGYNAEDVQDAVQEALIQLSDKLEQFRGGSLRAWLTTTTIRLLIDKHRQRLATEDIIPPVGTPPDWYVELVQQFLDGLEAHYRLTFKVQYLAHWDYKAETQEIRLMAQRSQVPDDTVINVLKRIAEIEPELNRQREKITKREADIQKLLVQIQQLSEESDGKRRHLASNLSTRILAGDRSQIDRKIQSLRDDISKLEDKIQRRERRRGKLLMQRYRNGFLVRTKIREAAFILGEPEGTIRARVHRLQGMGREFWEDHAEDWQDFPSY